MAWGRENIEWYRELNNYYKKRDVAVCNHLFKVIIIFLFLQY